MSEDRLHIACTRYLKLQHPNKLWFHTPNGGSRNVREAGKLKQMGVKKGVSDLMILEPNGEFAGLAIELKYGKNKATPEQLEFLEQLNKRGWKTAIIYTIDDFITEVTEYFKILYTKKTA